ncbi:MAG TPA: hypothetical protein VFV43_00460 [Limnobacter sp.]|nr:hypothetical protein [Limnobacter sp.]
MIIEQRTENTTTATSLQTLLPLNQEQRAVVVERLMSDLGLTREQAHRLVDGLSTSEARTLFDLVTGNLQITRELAMQAWGLTEAEADVLFPNGPVLSTFTNPFGRAFVMFLMLTYSLELDLKQIIGELIQIQKHETIAKAEDMFRGAIVQFATAMTAALVTGVFAGKCMFNAYKTSRTDPKNPNQAQDLQKAATDNMWFGPIGASLINQPITAAGEFGKAWYEREALFHDANGQEAGSQFQIVMSQLETTSRLQQAGASGL